MRYDATLALAGVVVLATGCRHDDTSDAADAGERVDVPASAEPDAGAADGFELLVAAEWSLPPGTERYKCVYQTVRETIFVRAFRPLIPLGTHHTVLTKGPKQRDDGIYDCNAGTNYREMVFGSGVGTQEFRLPEGIAVKIEAGEQLLLNLHLFNLSEDELAQTSGTEILQLSEDEVVHEAENLMVANLDLRIPPGSSTHVGGCAMNGDVTLLSVSPHMHMLGSHMRVVAHSSDAGEIVLRDAAYDFDEQLIFPLAQPVTMTRGDRIDIACSYNNTTSRDVYWGDSSLEEMCIAGIYRYPARGGGILCTSR
jgi:hypothetical protein